MDLNLFVLACIGILDIKRPVEIRLLNKNKRKPYGEFAAWAETRTRNGKVIRHVIGVNLNRNVESGYSIYDVIAHELVHSVLLENEKHDHNYHHNKRFQNICKILEQGLAEINMPVGALYNPLSDTD